MSKIKTRQMDIDLVASINRIQRRGAYPDKPNRRFENRKHDNKCFRCGRGGHFA